MSLYEAVENVKNQKRIKPSPMATKTIMAHIVIVVCAIIAAGACLIGTEIRWWQFFGLAGMVTVIVRSTVHVCCAVIADIAVQKEMALWGLVKGLTEQNQTTLEALLAEREKNKGTHHG